MRGQRFILGQQIKIIMASKSGKFRQTVLCHLLQACAFVLQRHIVQAKTLRINELTSLVRGSLIAGFRLIDFNI